MSAHSEVLLRNIEDVALFTNGTAVAAYRSGVEMLTDSQMSTHIHETVLCDDATRFAWSQELSLTKAYNRRHSRRGPLFDGKPYVLQLKGPRHMQMALNYSLRQGLHHGQSETAFDYPWSTCNQLFTEDRGLKRSVAKFSSRSEIRKLLPRNFSDFPDKWQADENGILIRYTFEELSLVENWYGTARNYMYSMLRKTSPEWIAEQDKDEEDGPAVTLDLLEKGYSAEDISTMLTCEGNAKYTQKGMSDMEICEIIDKQIIVGYGVDSVYLLSGKQKEKIASELKMDLGVRSDKQIARCLVMDYNR